MPTGVIVAGGRSTRFGAVDKSVADLRGVPMIRRVANRLAGSADPIPPGADRAAGGAPVVDEVVVNCRPDQRDALGVAMAGFSLPLTWAVDDETDRGPVAGIRNACRAAPAEYAAVIACDMPFVDPGFVATLFDDATGEHGSIRASAPFDAAIPRLDGRWLQTTLAVYRTDRMAAACDRALARGDRKLLDAVETLDAHVVDDATIRERTTVRAFTNVNTREEFDAAAAFIADRL